MPLRRTISDQPCCRDHSHDDFDITMCSLKISRFRCGRKVPCETLCPPFEGNVRKLTSTLLQGGFGSCQAEYGYGNFGDASPALCFRSRWEHELFSLHSRGISQPLFTRHACVWMLSLRCSEAQAPRSTKTKTRCLSMSLSLGGASVRIELAVQQKLLDAAAKNITRVIQHSIIALGLLLDGPDCCALDKRYRNCCRFPV